MTNITDAQMIHRAWDEEGSRSRLGLRPAASRDIQAALIPSGGDWQCVAADGAITRSIVWGRVEVALINPRGDMSDSTEGQIAMGMRATPIMDKALRVISVLADDPANSNLIGRIARAAIATVETAAPPIREPEPEETDEDES
jgi:hypothetical protein